MLRLETFDVGAGGLGGKGMRPSPAIGDLASELQTLEGPGVVIDRLCAALAGDDPRAARAQIDRLLDCGVSVEALLDSTIPRAAARLGEMWADDSLGFAGVTLGMTRLTEIFRSLSPTVHSDRRRHARRPRALFALAPGETHALGVVMAADYFERAGWAVRVELQADARMLARMARAQRFALIGLSAASRRMLPVVTATVERLRDAADPATPILVGGHLGVLEADLAAITGADAAYTDARLALAGQAGAEAR